MRNPNHCTDRPLPLYADGRRLKINPPPAQPVVRQKAA